MNQNNNAFSKEANAQYHEVCRILEDHPFCIGQSLGGYSRSEFVISVYVPGGCPDKLKESIRARVEPIKVAVKEIASKKMGRGFKI